MGKTYVDGDVLTANDANTYLQAVASIIPQVSGTGVSVDTATGIVSFSSATSIIITDAFSSAYRNYRINLESTGTASSFAFVLRDGSTNSTTGYDRTEILARNATVASATSVNQANANVMGIANTLIQGDIELSGPAIAVSTTAICRFGNHSNPAVQNTSNGITINYVTHRPTDTYDGLEITYSAAQSGTIRIYGYN